MSQLDSSRSRDNLRADVLHASSYSGLERDHQSLEVGNVINDAENSEQRRSSESMGSQSAEQPSLEQTQSLYYMRGLEEIENLQLLDLSALATWRLSSHKQGHGLIQLREDNPDSYWQSDGSMENSAEHLSNSDSAQLNHPHFISLQFSKKVSLERISIFTNYQLDESYTPLRIRIMAGSSNWDLTEVCVVNFEKPMGWSHIIFKGVRGDGLLKCFVVKIVILANHQDGKDSHVRAIKCFGKKSGLSSIAALFPEPISATKKHSHLMNYANESGILLNNQEISDHFAHRSGTMKPLETVLFEGADEENDDATSYDPATTQILSNVSEVLGFNLGFDSVELKSILSIR